MAFGTPVAGALAYSALNGTTVSPAYPAGITATNVLILIVGQKPQTANGGQIFAPSGWTEVASSQIGGGYGFTLGADTGNTNIYAFAKDVVTGAESGNLAVTLSDSNIAWAYILRLPGLNGVARYGWFNATRNTAPTSGSPFSVPLTYFTQAAPAFLADDIFIWAMCIPTDVTTPAQFSAYSVTSTGATFGTAVEINEPDSGVGNDIGGFSAYAFCTAGPSTVLQGTTVTVTAGGTTTNVRGPLLGLRVRDVTGVTQGLTPALFTNDQTFFGPTVTQGAGAQNLTPALFTNEQVFYGPTVTATRDLTPDLFTNNQTFFAPTVTSAYALTPALFTNNQTFFAPTVTATRDLTPALFTNEQTFYSPTVTTTRDLTPALFTNEQTFYSATVTTTRDLTPALFTNEQTFYSATATAAYSLTPDLFVNEQTFYSATATTTRNLTPDLFTNEQTFYGSIITQAGGSQFVAPALFTNEQTFYSATVTTGAVNVAPALFTNEQTFYAPTVTATRDLAPALFTNTQTFFTAATTATYDLRFEDYVDPGYVDPGYIGLAVTNTQVFYGPTLTATRDLTPALFTNTQVFYPATVSQPGEAQNLLPSLFVNLNQFFSAQVRRGRPPPNWTPVPGAPNETFAAGPASPMPSFTPVPAAASDAFAAGPIPPAPNFTPRGVA